MPICDAYRWLHLRLTDRDVAVALALSQSIALLLPVDRQQRMY